MGWPIERRTCTGLHGVTYRKSDCFHNLKSNVFSSVVNDTVSVINLDDTVYERTDYIKDILGGQVVAYYSLITLLSRLTSRRLLSALAESTSVIRFSWPYFTVTARLLFYGAKTQFYNIIWMNFGFGNIIL